MRGSFFLFFALLAAAAAEVVNFHKCDTQGQSETCTVREVRITPCPSQKNCRLRKGHDVSISFDFTPSFAATSLNTTVFWASNIGDLPWTDLDSDACKVTTCPSEAGKEQQFNYSLHVGKKLPDGRYTLKWLVFDTADGTKSCCFKTNIQIKK